VDPAVLKGAVDFSNAIADPSRRVDHLASLIGEIMRDPTQAQALRGKLGSHFAPAPAPAAPKAEPQYLVKAADGNVYIDPDKFTEWQTWREEQLEERFQKRIAPLEKTAIDLKTEKDAIALDKQVGDFSSRVHSDLKALPDYAANAKDIATAFDEDVTALLGRNPQATPHEIENCALRSYLRVTTPKAAMSAEARVQATLKAKAEGRTASPNGNGKSSVSATKLTEREALRAKLREQLVDPTTGRFL
jgi:hypothetical protein